MADPLSEKPMDMPDAPPPATAPAPGPPDVAPPPYAPPAGGMPPGGGMAPYPPAPGPGFNPAVYPPAPGGPGMPQPTQPGYGTAQQQMVVPPPPQSITVTTHQSAGASVVAFIDQCPNCKMGNLQEQYTPFGILCAIFLFPIGIICCMMSRHKICPVCGTMFHGR